MTVLNKNDIFYTLFDALRAHTDSVIFVEGDNPYKFYAAGNDFAIFLANVHFAGRTDIDEYRIQCRGSLPERLSRERSAGSAVFVVGYYFDLDVFCAWDPSRFTARSTTTQQFSIYTRLSKMKEARQDGLSVYIDSDEQSILLFRPDFAGLYIENAEVLHKANEADIKSLASTYTSAYSVSKITDKIDTESERLEFEVGRQKVISTSIKYRRNPRFRAEILHAYNYRCAMCGLQLELVEAAHIVPHAHPQGLDVISNGIALCALHHRSFDLGLLYVYPDYSINENAGRIEHLVKIGRADRLKWYRDGLRSSLSLPLREVWLPSSENFTLGNRIRGIGID